MIEINPKSHDIRDLLKDERKIKEDEIVDDDGGELRRVLLDMFSLSSLCSTGIRHLRLGCSYGISDEGLIEAASKFPLLEDLDISYCGNLLHKPVKVIGSSCPLLKSFKLNKEWHKYSNNLIEEMIDDEGPRSKDDDALAIAGTMHGLNHL
ncbi:hypothetical protein ACLB2K_021734 [Fragaria x ananassa]